MINPDVNIIIFFRYKRRFKSSTILSMDDLKRFRMTIHHYTKRVTIVDDVFCSLVAVWLLMILVTLCVRTLAVLHAEVQSNPQMLAISYLESSRAVLTLFSVCLAAHGVYQESLVCLEVLDDWYFSPFGYESIYMDIFVSRSMLKPAHLTVWKFAILNSSFLMTCCGAMLTYIIIGVQLHSN